MNWTAILQMIQERATTVALQILGALVLYVIGRWLISLVVSAVQRALAKQQIEATVFRFVGNALSIALNVTLVVAILGYFGVQTTTFAALIAATALAVGTAWAGLLANFAAGAFLVVLRPFKVGDFISAGGIIGTYMKSDCSSQVLIRRTMCGRLSATTRSSRIPSKTLRRTRSGASTSPRRSRVQPIRNSRYLA
jgi:small-conductance mechanosensitive channel